MRKWHYAGGGLVIAGGIAAYVHVSGQPEAVLARNWEMLDSYCVECHNDTEYTGDMSLEGMTLDDVHANAELFEEIRRRLKLGVMPPRDGPQPDPAVRAEFVNALTETLDAAAFAEPYASSTKVHRLNRAEYANAIRDLFGIEAELTELLPSDGGDFGFDNIADMLTTSPLLLERYLTVAFRVTDMAMGNAEAVPGRITYRIPFDTTQDYHREGLPLGTRGGIEVTHHFPADGEYVFGGRLLRGVEEGLFGVEGHDRPHEFVVLLDDEVVYTAEIGGAEDHQISLDEGFNALQFEIDPRLTSPSIPVTAGPHTVAVTWKEQPGADQSVWERVDRSTLEIHNPSGIPRLELAYLEGPFDVTGVSDNIPSRDSIFVCEPAAEAEEAACAEQIARTIARRAFRRPVTADDIASPLAFYEDERAFGGDFNAGIHAAVSRILVSPWFLFRAENESPDVPAGSSHPISDIELASRLSFFLWSSIPDDELINLAEQGRLTEPSVLEEQVRRMIADSRSDALVENFTGQWLQLRNLNSRVRPNLLLFPDFDDNLRQALRRETELLFAHVLREDLPVHELMNASYTFLNQRLARHYAVAGVNGQRFRRVELEDPNRWGLFGHGSLLSLTSQGTRTSPIVRGKFLVTEFWNNPPPAPPDDVPELEASAPKDRPSTVREQLELHRENPNCAACHDNIDPIGFALENFNAVGQWRELDRQGLEIDAAGTLADGTPVDGPVELRNALLADPELFAGTVTEKLMIYALGRGLEPADRPVVRQVVRKAAGQNYSLESIILAIVDSFPFQMRRNLPAVDGAVTIADTGE
ncbi:DUF1592 domain-containing protein [Candidatus Rariloculus sp.]|uniref:DUF1592 domain-containing protein n=1 Tax=Candidatus Rariloculus sp. TaxID=3101265 RepID=UPI003D0E1AC0